MDSKRMNIVMSGMSVKTWNLSRDNNFPVKRYGFPIVPDFGGAAHAYFGDTLKTLICMFD